MASLSATFRVDLRNFCSGLVKRQISDMFEAAGIELGAPPAAPSGGERRTLTLRYLGTVDWESGEDTAKVLRAVTVALFAGSTLPADKEALRALCEKEGLRIEADKVVMAGASGPAVKNLIFAAIGPKPEIVLIDATTNEIKITKNAEYCLVYDRPIPDSLLWIDLVSWWLEVGHAAANNPDEAGRALYGRLEQSLDSEPEKILMRQFFKTLRGPLGDKLPALVPQVYLHYDPYTVRERGGPGPLARQRMDFLLLMNGGRRVVLEIDGKQHYSEGERPSPRLYADMVVEDRRLRLSGYEVFRFGGYEFVVPSRAEAMLASFFTDLFIKCGYQLG